MFFLNGSGGLRNLTLKGEFGNLVIPCPLSCSQKQMLGLGMSLSWQGAYLDCIKFWS